MTSTYSRACTEALAIIDCLADEEYNKIPIEKLRFLENNCDSSYLFKIDSDVELAEQNVMDETYAILLAIYRDDFATENQKKILNTLLIQNFNEKEEEKKEKYTKYQELHGDVHIHSISFSNITHPLLKPFSHFPSILFTNSNTFVYHFFSTLTKATSGTLSSTL